MQIDYLNELIEKAKRHDNDAITQLIKETQSKLYFVALSMSKKMQMPKMFFRIRILKLFQV